MNRSGQTFVRPDPHAWQAGARRVSRRSPLSAGLRSIASRPRPDTPEHVGTLVLVRNGAQADGHATFYPVCRSDSR
jgi:hypothetical protein